MTSHTKRVGVVLALATFAASFHAAAEDPVPAQEQPVAAVWKVREMDFIYRSSVAVFTCGAMKDRIQSVLRAIGARDDFSIDIDRCDNSVVPAAAVLPGQPMPTNTWNGAGNSTAMGGFPTRASRTTTRTDREQSTHVHVRFVLPAAVTPEVLKELDNDKARRELISRMTGNGAARLNDPVVFAAQRQVVTLSHQTIGIEPVECELLEQMSNFFRELDVRIVRRSSSCNRDRVSRIPPQLTVESLIGVPFDPASGPQLPTLRMEGSTGQTAPAASGDTPAESAPAPPK